MKLINALRLAFTTIKNYIDTTLPLKLDIHQGAENSGKIMSVDEEGNLIPVENEIDLSAYETVENAQLKYDELELNKADKEHVVYINVEDNENVENPDVVTNITIDTELSEESINPVQNKVVTKAISDLQETIDNLKNSENYIDDEGYLVLGSNTTVDSDGYINL